MKNTEYSKLVDEDLIKKKDKLITSISINIIVFMIALVVSIAIIDMGGGVSFSNFILLINLLTGFRLFFQLKLINAELESRKIK